MNKSIAKAATDEFSKLVILFLAQLSRFIIYSQESAKEITAEKIDELFGSNYPMLLNYKKDADKVHDLINDILELDFTDNEFLRLKFIFSNFKTTLLSVDPYDTHGSWNFFDSGLDVLIEDVTHLISTKKVTNPTFHFDFSGSALFPSENRKATYQQA